MPNPAGLSGLSLLFFKELNIKIGQVFILETMADQMIFLLYQLPGNVTADLKM